MCNRLGFSYATISLVNEDTREISTVRGKNVPPGWVADAHHLLNSQDIQADVVRTGQVEASDTWDPRFDETIWKCYGHAELLRVWVPLGRIGTIEAGFNKNEKSEVPRLLIELLKCYALDVTVAIQNAQYYEREQRQAMLMARLHEVSYDLQTDPCQRDETALLKHITHSALDLLGASVIVLYPLNRRDGSFAPPIWVGSDARGEHSGQASKAGTRYPATCASASAHGRFPNTLGRTNTRVYHQGTKTPSFHILGVLVPWW